MVQAVKDKYHVGVLCAVLAFFCFGDVVHAADTDRDGLEDELEGVHYTDPNNPDTDGDGYLDGIEVFGGYSPHAGPGVQMHQHDYDHDGLNDWLETWFGGDIGVVDTDGDGKSDAEEVWSGKSPKDPENIQTFSQKIVVDRTTQRLFYFVDGIKIFNYPVSTGNPGTPTPAGTFSIAQKIDEKRYVGPGYDLSGVKWNMQFKPMYYIHAAYWHNDFGKRTHSHGCVNMREADAAHLYTYVPVGVPVEIIGETPKRFVVGT